MITPKLDHAAEAVGRLLQQFRGKPKLEAFVRLLGDQVQAVEDALVEILLTTDVLTVVGAQLDVLGSIVGQERAGQSDDVYRLFIRARILVNNSRGTVEEILAILALLLGPSAAFTMVEPPDIDPASFEITITTPVPSDLDAVVIARFALEAKSPAIRGLINFAEEPVFRFDTAGRGFDQGNKFAGTVGA